MVGLLLRLLALLGSPRSISSRIVTHSGADLLRKVERCARTKRSTLFSRRHQSCRHRVVKNEDNALTKLLTPSRRKMQHQRAPPPRSPTNLMHAAQLSDDVLGRQGPFDKRRVEDKRCWARWRKPFDIAVTICRH